MDAEQSTRVFLQRAGYHLRSVRSPLKASAGPWNDVKSCLIFVRQVTAEVELSRAVAPLAEVLAADGPSTALEELLHKDHRQSSPASAQALLEVGLGEQLRESLLVQVEDCV